MPGDARRRAHRQSVRCVCYELMGSIKKTLQQIYHSTVVAHLAYAASAWRGLTKASDRQCINSVINRARRQGYSLPDLPTFDELCAAEDDKLFDKAIRESNRVLHTLLLPPSTASQCYNLRQLGHSIQLPKHSEH